MKKIRQFFKLMVVGLFVLSPMFLNGQSYDQKKAIENQYCADLGNGDFLNPILKGNYADPTVMRDGENYYMTHSSFDNIPGLLIWHSKDLVNWKPLTHALTEHVGSVWAPDMVKFKDKFYIYFPANGTNWVVTATDPEGPWSNPVDLKLGGIDPGHVVGPDGKRFLHLSGGDMVSLSGNGLKVTSQRRKVYEGWEYPNDWIVECFCLESPKLTRQNGYYYMTVAQGGTAGPPTGHMVVAARSRTPWGPWENSPYNPIIRSTNRENKWASIGHGTLVDTPDGKWWMVFHGFENDDRTIGRQTLLLPIEWTADGWYKVPDNAELAEPLKKPAGVAFRHGMELSDDFENGALGTQWNIINNENPQRFKVDKGVLNMKTSGDAPSNSLPLTIMPSNNSYQVTVEVKAGENAKGGMGLYYNTQYYLGLEVADNAIYRLGGRGQRNKVAEGISNNHAFLRLVNDHHDLLYYYSVNGKDWKRIDFVSEVSGYHSNALAGWGYLRPGIFSAGEGEVAFRNFQYIGLD